ncbi:hypothetical protein PPERSA_09813 [Pseudocohnilembus persalinus]|uniref:Uncharacterized protein n=1 Tax=Pseudocohnilembus persalinus TaxID=266149 RepID=A0A0V0QTE4_PSEPJ|nr:hypothetical protein PPERSA_09813 [Pseudocohnilembus persalinus]|eukprot:KRX05673.1 hypothetical protein PPERSA_09813 [Pseudocohnilembus persalinus]
MLIFAFFSQYKGYSFAKTLFSCQYLVFLPQKNKRDEIGEEKTLFQQASNSSILNRRCTFLAGTGGRVFTSSYTYQLQFLSQNSIPLYQIFCFLSEIFKQYGIGKSTLVYKKHERPMVEYDYALFVSNRNKNGRKKRHLNHKNSKSLPFYFTI